MSDRWPTQSGRIMVYAILFMLFINLGVTSTIFRFRYPKATETEIFLAIPHTFFWNFNIEGLKK